VKLDERSTLANVVAAVAGALAEAGIQGVLTGGACAALYTRGVYQSSDLDFILISGDVAARQMDAALQAIGFRRRGNEYVHPLTHFFVEFPRGPLAIGRDSTIAPTALKVGRRTVLALSPTDSCRDRLAAFYFWDDRQSLRTAVVIARMNAVDLRLIEKWSREEGFAGKYNEFKSELSTVSGGGRKSSGRKKF
jgi:hypothetical protein